MVIAPRTPKRPATPTHKKRSGQHRKQNKHYMKTYWPYIPMLTVAFAINGLLQGHVGDHGLQTTASDVPATRLQFWTHASNSIVMLIGIVIFAATAYVVTHHARAWHRVLVKGERFILNHHLVDAGLVGLVLAGVIVTRSV